MNHSMNPQVMGYLRHYEAVQATDELNLHRHLFGSDRLLPPRTLRDGIAALQDGRCFYCRNPLGSTPEADHFIPRIR